MKYKVGDWVQLINRRGRCWNQRGEMDKYIGNIVKITKIHPPTFTFEGGEHWAFETKDIAGYAKNKIVTDILMDL